MSADCVVEGCIDEVINLVDSDTAMGEEDTASTSSDIEMDDEDNAEPAEEEIKALTPEELVLLLLLCCLLTVIIAYPY